MAQTTGALSGRAAKVEYSTNNSTWTDISGETSSIEVSGGERNSAELFTFDGDKPVVLLGKRTPIQITGQSAFTVATADAFRTFETLYSNGTALKIRYIMTGSATTGDWRFTSDTGYLIHVPYPSAEAAPGDPIMYGWVFKTSGLNGAVVA